MDENTFKSFMSDVEKDQNGSPVILYRWGFRKAKLGGKIYIMPASREEADTIRKNPPAEILDLNEDRKSRIDGKFHAEYGYCDYLGYASCAPRLSCRACQAQGGGIGGFYQCVCTQGGG